VRAGASEQSTGLNQVNTAINQMDQATQQNAAMVEEHMAASHALRREAQELAHLVGQFRLDAATRDPLREELRKVAPHAFSARPGAPARPSIVVAKRRE
jgi:methyl-accepting chemotaxis protein